MPLTYEQNKMMKHVEKGIASMLAVLNNFYKGFGPEMQKCECYRREGGPAWDALEQCAVALQALNKAKANLEAYAALPKKEEKPAEQAAPYLPPEEILEIRNSMNLTQAEFASLVGFAGGHAPVSRWENGHTVPDSWVIKRIIFLRDSAKKMNSIQKEP